MINGRFNKLVTAVLISAIFFICQSLSPQQREEHPKPTNLKILPKNMSGDEVVAVMRTFSKSLGVKCNHCHAQRKDDEKKLDFASDEKHEKTIARKMMKMTGDINKKYIAKIGDLEKITCVTCHMGHLKPIISVDSLAKQ